MRQTDALDTLIIGGGMITHDQILPSLYHLQRIGAVGSIAVCALNSAPLRILADDPAFAEAFPGQGFSAHPALAEPETNFFPDGYKAALRELRPRQVAVVAVPDQFHYEIVMESLACGQHVVCVKPLVLEYRQAVEVEQTARQQGLFVGVEYHKRFDRRALLARKECENGTFGRFVIGEARMIEPYYYRHSNFQNWFTCDKTDPFVYVGCHYVDQVFFITGLKPTAVSVNGVKRRFPNGNEAYMWASGRVIFEGGAVLSVTDGLGYPDQAAGTNDQGLSMYFEGDDKTAMLEHDDQFRGVQHGYLDAAAGGGSAFRYVNPDYFKLVPWEGTGLRPVGYGYESIAALFNSVVRIEEEAKGMDADAALTARRRVLSEIDAQGIIATPANSSINELVVEAARLSIQHEGAFADILHGQSPRVQLRAAL